MRRLRQRGASGLMIAFILVLLAVVLLAVRVLSRLGNAAEDRNNTVASLQRAQTALDQYVAAGGAASRLPCPADPSQDSGLEVAASSKTCSFDAGTLPWRTIGARRDDAYDAWGRKLSYRVYTDNGNKGSLVQPGGPSLVNCYPDFAVGGGTDGNGLCNTDHTTSTHDVLKKKSGLDLTDFGTPHTKANNDPTAYVVISHGPTGYGGYTVSGDQLTAPKGDEKNNTNDTGPFWIEAWSDPDTSVTSNAHYDDLLVYRTVADLAQKAGLQARAWGVASLTFDAATVAQGGGDSTQTDTGASTLTYGSTTVTGFSGTTATNISFDSATNGIGVVGGSGSPALLSYLAGESMQVSLGTTARQFAITLNDFLAATISGSTYAEHLQLTFYKGSSTVTVVTKAACNASSTTTSTLSVNVGADFDRVEVRPAAPTLGGGSPFTDSDFSISALSTCRSGVTCSTAIAAAGVTCP